MAQRPTADYPIDANTTSGTDLSLILNRFQTALESGNSGSSRPAYITAGGLWVKEGDPMELYLYDGTADRLLYDTSNGINVTEGLWTLVDENDAAGEIQRPSDVLIDGKLTVTGDADFSAKMEIKQAVHDTASDQTGALTFPRVTGDSPDLAAVFGQGDGGLGVAGREGLKFYTGGQGTYQGTAEVMTIDADGNVGIGVSDSPWLLHARSDSGPRIRVENTTDAQASFDLKTATRETRIITDPSSILRVYDQASDSDALTIGVDGNVGIGGLDNPTEKLHIDSGNVLLKSEYNGTGVTESKIFFQTRGAGNWRNSYIKADSSSLVFGTGGVGSDYTNAAPRMTIAADGRVDITGSLYVNGNPKIGTKELIETLSTLRNATKDEETVEGLRDAIGDAIGGLIQKFEAIQAEAKEKLEEAYNQAGTQEITPDKGTKDDKPEAGTLDLEE